MRSVRFLLRGSCSRVGAITAVEALVIAMAGCAGHALPKLDYPYTNLPGPAPEPRPGTKLAFGQPAWIDPKSSPTDWVKGQDAGALTGPIGTTVLDMYTLDKSYWRKSVGGDFTGRTPVVVVAEFDYRQTREKSSNWDTPQAPVPPLLAALPNGTPVPFVNDEIRNAVYYEPRNCVGRKIPVYNVPAGNQRYIACEIFAPKSRQLPTKVIYDGAGSMTGYRMHSPYISHPIEWIPNS